ncbi:MAG: ABC transporter permease [Candidatus Thorarchaeota archaeon]
MSKQDFASRDLKRRPFRTTLILLTLVTVVTATTFLFLFANVLLDVSLFLTSSGPLSAFSVFFESFIFAILILVLALGVVVVSSTISLEMVSRRKDIALMKAIGTTIDSLYDHFIAQAIALLLGSIVFGITIGTGLYMIGLIWLSATVPGLSIVFNFPVLQIGLLSFVYILAGYFAAQKPIIDTVNESPVTAMNPDVGMKVRRVGFLDQLGLSVRVATRASGRRLMGRRRTMISLFLGITLASILWIGGGIVETTTDTYLTRGMGTNIVAIGNPDLLEQYYSAYSLDGEYLNDSFSFRGEQYIIDQNLIGNLTELVGVTNIDERFVEYTAVEELAASVYIQDPSNPEKGYYTTIGGQRQSSTLIVGLDWENTVSDWYFEGSRATSQEEVWVGGVLANTLFDDPLIERMEVYGVSLNVSGIMLDVLNGGNVAVTSLSILQDTLGISGGNLLLVQVDDYSSTMIDEIEDILSEGGYGFEVFLQQELLEENRQTMASLWSLLLPLPVIALVSAFLSLMNYLLVSVFGRFQDYVIMRSVGAKPSFLAKCIVAEGVDIGGQSGIPAVIVGAVFSALFLVPEAAVPSILYLPFTISVMILALFLVVVLAAIPVYLLFTSRTDLRVSEFQV